MATTGEPDEPQQQRSIIVKGSSLEDAIGKGLLLLGARRGEITYEVLQEGARGRSNGLGTPYRLRVSVGGAPVPAPAETPDEAGDAGVSSALTDLGADELAPLSCGEFLALLDLVAASLQPTGETADSDGVAPSSAAGALDGKVFVEIAPSRMEAFVTVTPPQQNGREMTAADVHAALGASGVRYGLDEAAIGEAARRRLTRHRVAAGLAPKMGANARLRFVTDVDGDLCDEPAQGREVQNGDLVAIKTPAGEGAPGMTVLGETLPPHGGRDLPLGARRGRNVCVSPDGLSLFATASGVVSAEGGGNELRLHVESALILDRDITAAQGNVEFVGDIVIRGSVGRGVAVRAGGNVYVNGNVDVAVIQAGGSVSVGGGILGRGAGVVRALAGNVQCRFVEDARVDAAGDIEVEDYVRNAQVRAGRRANVGGAVVGGQVYGEQGVRVRVAGSEAGAATTLAAGTVLRAREQIEKLRERAQAAGERLVAVEAATTDLLQPERGGVPLAAGERVQALRAVTETARLRAQIERFGEEKSRLVAEIEEARRANVSVSVTQKAHARTRVAINDAALELPVVTQYATFTRDANGDIRLTALT